MKSRLQREQELLNSGLIDTIKSIFKNTNANIPEKYYLLIADYIDTINQLDFEGYYLNASDVAKSLPDLISKISEEKLSNIHGKTIGSEITMNSTLDYETNKLFFFHELTHAIQTRYVSNHEECAFYNGNTGMFLTEGATQFIAEILYHISNDSNLEYKYQENSVRGHNEHIPYSPLSEYQLNGNILLLLAGSLGISLNQILGLSFRKDGRQLLKEMYEAFPDNEGKFEEFMFDLEKIYYIDKLMFTGYTSQLQGGLVNIILEDGQSFKGNIKTQGELINKVEKNLIANFITNYDTDYILQNYQQMAKYLTTTQLKNDFFKIVNELVTFQNEQLINQSEIRR